MREVLTDNNDFGFSILTDTDEVTNAVLIGSVFCIVSCQTTRTLETIRGQTLIRTNALIYYSVLNTFGSEPADSDTTPWKWGCWKCSLCTVAIYFLVLAAIVIVVLFLLKPEWFRIK